MVTDVSLLPASSPLAAFMRGEGGAARVCVPLIAEGTLFGSLNLAMCSPREFPPGFLVAARELADALSVNVRQGLLQLELRNHVETLETRVAERTARLAEVNAELESFAYTVSHDLRAPLRAMQGFARALIEDFGESLEDTAREYAARIDTAAQRMDGLILDLLAYSRISRNEMRLQPVDMREAVEEALDHCNAQIVGKGASVSASGHCPTVIAEKSILVLAIMNLLTNALKFVKPGVCPEISVTLEARDGTGRLSMRDNGIGIAPQYHARIFRIFERLHGAETYPGTGIGLAMVQKAITRFGGSAGVLSSPGEGSTF